MHNIYTTTRPGFFLYNVKHKHGGSLITNNDTIKKMTTQINNPSTGIAGLGTQSKLLAKSEVKPTETSIIFGGDLTSQLGKLNFNTNKSKYQKNIKLKL